MAFFLFLQNLSQKQFTPCIPVEQFVNGIRTCHILNDTFIDQLSKVICDVSFRGRLQKGSYS